MGEDEIVVTRRAARVGLGWVEEGGERGAGMELGVLVCVSGGIIGHVYFCHCFYAEDALCGWLRFCMMLIDCELSLLYMVFPLWVNSPAAIRPMATITAAVTGPHLLYIRSNILYNFWLWPLLSQV